MLIVSGSIAGGVIVALLVLVAFLAGRSGSSNDQGADAPRSPLVAANDDRESGPPAPPMPPSRRPRPFAPRSGSSALGSSHAVMRPSATVSGGSRPAAIDPARSSSNGEATPADLSSADASSDEGATDGSSTDESSPASERYASVADLIEAVEPSVCRINVESSRGSSTGSGFVVDASGIIATNYHVVAGALRASVMFPDETTAPVEGFVHLDAKKDIALIVIDPPRTLTVARLAGELPRKGENLVAIGTPLGLDFSASEGKVSAIRSEEDLQKFGADKKGTWIQSTAPISPGNSGGPLFNMKGEVVAANTLTITIGQNLNFGISAGDIRQALEKKSAEVTQLSPDALPQVADSGSHGRGRRRTIDGTNTTRGRDLLAGLSEVQLLVGTFSFDPTGKVEQYVVRMAKNTLEKAELEQKRTNAALMAVFMKFEGAGGSSGAKTLVIDAHIIVRDKNQMVTVWKERDEVGSMSESSFIRGDIPLRVRRKVLDFFNDFRSARRKAINERDKAADEG